ncbi:Transcription factor bHLH130-like protein [Drosera capensis]
MDSYIENPFHQNEQSNQQNSGLLRFRSAPSSLLSNLRVENGSYELSLVGKIGERFDESEGKHMIVGQGQLPQGYGKSGGEGSELVRQSSSPAGFLAHVNAQNGYPMMRGSGNFSIGSGTNQESSHLHTSAFKGQINFSSRSSSSASRLPRIPEIGDGNLKGTGEDDVKFGGGRDDGNRLYHPGLSFSWDDSGRLVENGSEVRGDGQDGRMLYSGLDVSFAQNSGRPHLLSHHLSLPKNATDVVHFEKMMDFQDAVPCRIRAKRGCATHPRSIAERMRRTRISDRIKRLQELVPNMEKVLVSLSPMSGLISELIIKQINTAEMLDLAVDYIKDLQEEYKKLSATRAKCRCSIKHESAVNDAA